MPVPGAHEGPPDTSSLGRAGKLRQGAGPVRPSRDRALPLPLPLPLPGSLVRSPARPTVP